LTPDGTSSRGERNIHSMTNVDPTRRLTGKTCLITGAASGIGRGTAQVFAESGAQLVLTDINSDGLSGVADELGKSVAMQLPVDIASEDAVASLLNEVGESVGSLDAVVCSHGYLDLEDGPLESHKTDVFDRTVAINLRGTYFTVRGAIPLLMAAGGGSIVLMSSLAALRTPSSIAYGATKGALNAMGKTISGQYGSDGIRCNVICPGPIQTPMMEKAMSKHNMEPPATHLGRIGQPREVGFLAAFLCSDESSYITATVQTVDGGLAQH